MARTSSDSERSHSARYRSWRSATAERVYSGLGEWWMPAAMARSTKNRRNPWEPS